VINNEVVEYEFECENKELKYDDVGQTTVVEVNVAVIIITLA